MFQDRSGPPAQRAVLLVAHGSRRAEPAAQLEALAASLGARLAGARVETAYLEITPPSIPEALRGLLAEGFEHVQVIPFFLSSGRHVVEDIPREVEEVAAEHPDARVEVLAAVGTHPAMVGLLREIAEGEAG